MNFFANKNVVMFFGITTLIMAYIVMVIVDPIIDQKDGFDVIALQLAFFKEHGLTIVSSWDIEAFKKWIFTDYLYALNYVFFFSSLLFWLGKKKNSEVKWFVYIALFAGLFDWIENSLELWFLHDINAFSSVLFFLHSILSTLKWLALPAVLWKIVKLLKMKG